MATIIIFIIIAIFTSITLKRKNVNKKIVQTIIKFIVVWGLFLGLFVPLSGYEDKKMIKEITPIQYENGKYFKTQNSKIYYQYQDIPKVARVGEETIIVEDTIKISSAKVIKTDCQEGKIIVYSAKAKRTIWTFGLSYKKEYVIYDPLTYTYK